MTTSDNRRQEAAAIDTPGHLDRRTRWRALALATLAGLSLGTAVASPKEPAQDSGVPAQCAVPDDTAMIEGALPRLARKLKTSDPLTVVVIGSGSAVGSGTSRKEAAFPFRFETRLQKTYAKPRIRLVVLAAMGQTASLSYARIAKEVVPLKPALVIWQTGSADAARGVPVMEFGSALERGIGDLRDQGSDVLLIDSQFSPRASLLVNTDAYREAVRWNARRYDLPLFKRYDTMQYWWSHDVFDLDAEDKASQTENADRIHDCVAALLVRVVERGVGIPSTLMKRATVAGRCLCLVLATVALVAGGAHAAPTGERPADVCAAPAALGRLTEALPKTRAALLAGHPLKIVTLGSSSTAGAGASAARFSYPSRLAVELAQRRPAATVEIVNRGINGEDAPENLLRLQHDVIAAKPDLVIWQFGTNAVIHDPDYAEFGRIVQQGIDRMRAAGIELLLIDLQYAPRVIEVPDHRRMLEFFDTVGARNHVPVFHRYAVMKYWADGMRSDYVSMLSSDGLHLNDTSYGCMAERLADAIVGEPPAMSPAPARVRISPGGKPDHLTIRSPH